MMTTKEITDIIKEDPFANVTFSGGDPMFQPDGFTELAEAIHIETSKTIWCFTGFKFETLIKNHAQKSLLEKIDVLVDGPFVLKLKDTDLIFRGSSNQRIIDVKASLKSGEVVLLDYNPTKL